MTQIGPDVTLYRGDSRDILPTLQGPFFVVTDPPYGLKLMSTGTRADRGQRPAFRGRRLIAGDRDQSVGVEVIDLCFARRWPVLAFADRLSPWPGGRDRWRQHLFWFKGENSGIGGDRDTCWKQTTELIQVGRFPRVYGSRDCDLLMQFPVVAGNYDRHPTAKPVNLMRYLVRKLVPKGGVVLDPFMGSGRTGLACLQLGIKFVGVEIDPAYYAVAADELTAARGGGMFRHVQLELWS